MTTRALFTIVLAAGEGTRLRSLTRALHGEDLPKQFAVILGGHSLLQATLTRTSRLSPANRTVVVVSEARERLAERQLTDFPGADPVAQPKNLGTGPGLLLPLARVLARDPDAIVAIVPSDHYVRDVERFVESVKEAEAVARAENSVVLLSAVPDAPETQYGWVVTSENGDGRGHRVLRFAEKPIAATANELFTTGALWNTFIMVGPARCFWELGRRHLPGQSAQLDAYRRAVGTPSERGVLSALYERMAPADFSRDVLERAEGLRVVRLEPCGWSDWGTPERVLRSLRGTSDYEVLVGRLRSGATARAKSLRPRSELLEARQAS